MVNEYKDLAYPGVYPDENKIIPYSPRRRFGFTGADKIIDLESMKNMSIDQIIGLYKLGYTISTTENAVPPDGIEQYERDRKYGFAGLGSQSGIYISTGAILLGIGLVALLYYLKRK